MTQSTTLLSDLLDGQELDAMSLIHMEESLKPVFYGRGFMHWARKHFLNSASKDIDESIEPLLLEFMGRGEDDQLVDSVSSLIAHHHQSAQQRLFYHLPRLFLQYEPSTSEPEICEIVSILQKGLKSRRSITRIRSSQIISRYAESSNAQARRALAGETGEKTLEVLLRSLGWRRGDQYGKGFMYQNSVTDFTVPYVRDWHAYRVQAYIAIQSSTNDRAKLTASALHGGAKRYLCSLNGCTVSSKTTASISDSLARSFRESETFYVVIEEERQRAIKDAHHRILRYKGTKKEINAKKRLDWLLKYTINYSQFVQELSKLTPNE